MKILFVHDRFGAFGGAEANALLSAVELKRRGHTVGILHGPVTGRGEKAWRDTFQSFYPLGVGDNKARTHAAYWEFRPDVVFVHKMPDIEVLEQLAASRVPVIRMVHDHDLYCMRSYKYFFWNRNICQRAASAFCLYGCGAFLSRRRDGGWPLKWVSYLAKRKEIRLNHKFQRMLVASQYMKEELLRNRFDEEKIRILPPATDWADTSIRSSFSERNLIIFVGQIIRGKGVDVLIEALSRISVPFECAIIGDGNFKGYCQVLAQRLQIADHIHFTGFLPQTEIRNYYREATVAVMSSIWPEPFGASGLEGMRYGLPVVAFNAGGIKEWLIDGHNGFLIPWMDRGCFATRVEQLLCDKPLARQL
ncbi:MAG TPA: glycosyltransferase family 4 protein, partial [Verrucomicrobiae bacterium]